MSGKKAIVSVIIPTFNSERFLEKCLMSLGKQSYRELDVIVVDDGSIDRTVEIAERFKCRVIRNWFKAGRAEAKNTGIWESLGAYLFFADSDMEFSPNVIAECLDLVRESWKIGGVVVPERSVGDNFWVQVRDFERSFYEGSLVESARFFPANLVKRVGGFEEDLVFFEESTLPFKLQKEGFWVHSRIGSEIFHHEENFSLKSWLQKKAHYGETVRKYKYQYSRYFRKQMGFGFRLYLFARDWRRFWGRPKLAMGVVALKSLEYLSVAFGYVSSRLG